MERTLKIFISCALGAGIGTFAALEINGYFWWLGLLAGWLVGYVSYEFKTVIAGVCKAWKEVVGWKPNKDYWKFFGLTIMAYQLTALTFLVAIFVINYFLPFIRSGGVPEVFLYLWFIGILITVWTLIPEPPINLLKRRNRAKQLIKIANPFSFYFYWVPFSIFWIVKRIPKAIVVLARFIKTVFILIYSDIRLLCGVGAAIGTAIGYFAGSVIIGMFAGGVFGVFNYKLVSIKLLRVNARNK